MGLLHLWGTGMSQYLVTVRIPLQKTCICTTHVLHTIHTSSIIINSDKVSCWYATYILTNFWSPIKVKKKFCLFPARLQAHTANTVLTWLQDDSNLRWSPKNKMSANKVFYSCYIHLIHNAISHSIYLHQSVSLSPSSQSVPSDSTDSLLTSPSSSPSSHNIPSVPSTTLDIWHFLKLYTVTSGEICCHAFMIHTEQTLHLYFLVYNLFNP
jgi:hypothetical protein